MELESHPWMQTLVGEILMRNRTVSQPGPPTPAPGGSPGERLMGCMVLSSVKVPSVPLIRCPGQAHRGDTSQAPADAQRSQLL